MLTLEKVKAALLVSNSAFDAELNLLMESAYTDLGIAGVRAVPESSDAVVDVAVLTYCKARFGTPANYEQLKAAYDEQKAQLQMATGYTDWGDEE